MLRGCTDDKPIFVGENKIYNSTVNDVLLRHCRNCGISEISIHGLRHTHASLLLFAGVSIASVVDKNETAYSEPTKQVANKSLTWRWPTKGKMIGGYSGGEP